MGYIDRGRRRNSGGCLSCGTITGCLGCLVLMFGGLAALVIAGILWWNSNEPKPPTPNFTPNPVEAQNLENKLEQASSNAVQDGTFDVTVTESEVSSWLNLRAPSVTNSDLPLQNMQVVFENGDAAVYGEMDTEIASVGTLIDFDLSVGADGKLQVSIADIDAGGISVPGEVRDELNAQIRGTIETELQKLGNTADYTITNLQINNGSLTIQGTKP